MAPPATATVTVPMAATAKKFEDPSPMDLPPGDVGVSSSLGMHVLSVADDKQKHPGEIVGGKA